MTPRVSFFKRTNKSDKTFTRLTRKKEKRVK